MIQIRLIKKFIQNIFKKEESFFLSTGELYVFQKTLKSFNKKNQKTRKPGKPYTNVYEVLYLEDNNSDSDEDLFSFDESEISTIVSSEFYTVSSFSIEKLKMFSAKSYDSTVNTIFANEFEENTFDVKKFDELEIFSGLDNTILSESSLDLAITFGTNNKNFFKKDVLVDEHLCHESLTTLYEKQNEENIFNTKCKKNTSIRDKYCLSTKWFKSALNKATKEL